MQQAGIPAWKRLGLKLKYAKEAPEPAAISNGHQEANVQQSAPAEPPKKKRKVEPEVSADSTTQNNSDASPLKPAMEEGRRPKKPKKRVSFSADTKLFPESSAPSSPDNESKAKDSSTKQKKPKSKSKKIPQPAQVQKPNASLDYLNQYYKNRSAWKFNKNRETWILKHVYLEGDIPREYDIPLAKYIHGLQGASARQRLQAQCLDVLQKEKNSKNEGNISRGDKDRGRDEEFFNRFLKDLEEVSGPGSQGAADEDYMSWIRQQSRARLLLWSLGVDDQVLESKITQLSGSNGELGDAHTNGDSKVPQKEKKRKNRTAVVDYDSSSSSSSGSSSESDSDSDSDSDTDTGASDEERGKQHQAEETSSSGSSSEDETDSDSESSTDSDN